MPADSDLPQDLLVDAEALARAEAALTKLSGRYLEWAEADLARLEAALAEATAKGGADALARLFAAAHDMKGQGATFDYPLVSEFGQRLCRLIETAPSPDRAELARMAGLVRAMAEVIRRRLAGDGGAEGQRLRSALDP